MKVKIANDGGVLRVVLTPDAPDGYEDIVMEAFGEALGFRKTTANRIVGFVWESVASARVNASDPAPATPAATAQ